MGLLPAAGFVPQPWLEFQMEYIVHLQASYAAGNGNSPNSQLVTIVV